ncbi:DUF2752 domain-containing protein [Pedobacter sp. Leaf194]|uniref:DUF2752 domain-containing protein n=1 Tax=Pedobacter sp. Leaf194 TaxID=1736297 RepID=UPI0007026D78|nr:DUF2752 domain-containing protein [Pedobacter sp. Leaf194]KQS35219.1 hypothetical protein ASG14_13545 [Pedobacter sp. Leaf194]RYD78276.1 MAG: DUF2752 domain-containing protein [Sphingobacteriales bacterium]
MLTQQKSDIFDWLSGHLLSCPFKAQFGFDCPGCGLQRSVLALLKGNLVESFKFYPATIPLLALLIFTFIHLKVDFKFGAQLIKLVFTGIAVIILINYIYKIYNHQLIN